MSSYDNTSLDDSPKGVLSLVISILSGIAVISAVVFTCSNITETIAGFINPEYGAIKEIISFVK
jgi:uncharacterized protein involved in cysteine biosynthesis